jgi:DNA polymerase
MPIPLKFSGAHTHRFSGDWKMNMQNLDAGHKVGKTGTLRKSLMAPEGHTIMTCDAAQIEARITAWICKQSDMVQQFADGVDVYSAFASDIYHRPITKKDKNERQVGKKGVLGLGFAAGDKVLLRAILADNRDYGMDVDMDLPFASTVVKTFRGKYRNIPATWRWLNEMIPYLAEGHATGETFGPCVFEKQAILLPSGLRLFYPDLRFDREKGNWYYWGGRGKKKLYGGVMLENVVQALDRVLVMDAAVRIVARARRELGITLKLAHQVHDEVVFVPRLEWVDDLEHLMLEEMSRRPDWGPDLPLASEVGKGVNYGAAK